MNPQAAIDPLAVLPPEIILRILEFAPVSALGAATRLSKAWHRFIDETHQDAIYSSHSKTSHPEGVHDFSFLQVATSFAKYFDGITSWKTLCKRQTLLPRNWNQERPITTASVLQIGNHPIWRFRPDFKRRFFLSTSQAGGLNVTDMDTGLLLWRLPPTRESDGEDSVRAYAHLEYEDGTAVWDRWGDSIEVWKTELDGLVRGEFRRVAILPHDCQTRGFQLAHGTLCVVSTEGKGFVYDVESDSPKLQTRLKIREDAVGHMYQDDDVVMYSMGTRGYDFHSKTSGKHLGTLEPLFSTRNTYHIKHPAVTTVPAREGRHGPTSTIFPPQAPRSDRMTPISIERGPLRPHYSLTDQPETALEVDEWGAGMLSGSLMVGVSRHGRIFICWDWQKAIASTAAVDLYSCIIECDSDGATFDLGGWLSVNDNRILCEIQDRVYVLALSDDGRVQEEGAVRRASYSFLTSSAPQLAVPVSFMALYDDCIMSTYTTLGWRQRHPANTEDGEQDQDGPARIFPTKVVRILSLAPSVDGVGEQPALWESQRPADETERTQTGLLQLVSMLGDELDDDDEFM